MRLLERNFLTWQIHLLCLCIKSIFLLCWSIKFRNSSDWSRKFLLNQSVSLLLLINSVSSIKHFLCSFFQLFLLFHLYLCPFSLQSVINVFYLVDSSSENSLYTEDFPYVTIMRHTVKPLPKTHDQLLPLGTTRSLHLRL